MRQKRNPKQNRNPVEILVYDDLEPCPYLPAHTARLPMRFPLRTLAGEEMDRRLAAGDRRQGNMLYRAACPSCAKCQPTRVLVDRFVPNRTQRRVARRGEALLDVEIGPPTVDAQRVKLYNRHKRARGLDSGERRIGEAGYSAFLVDTCCETFELRYRLEGRLVGVALTDRGAVSLSAVYCYFDPDYSFLSPGVWSILKQIELARVWGMQYLYLGFYLPEPSRMSYKGTWHPQQRLVRGAWRDIAAPERLLSVQESR